MSESKLIEAVKAGDGGAVAALCESPERLRERDEHGRTALHWAAAKGDLSILGLLVGRGAEVSAAGSDLRTPYEVALAAGHAEAARLLREAGGGADDDARAREYCAAYRLSELCRFEGWADESRPADDEEGGGELLFLQRDFTVTGSMWRGEGVRFARVTPEWKAFCADALGFGVADELDLLAPAPREG